MLSAFTNSLKIPELRQRIFFTAALIFVCRLVSVIPVPGVDAEALRAIMDRMAAQGGDIGFMGLLDLFSGGALTQAAIGALGIMPSISASIILQLLTAVVPSLEKLAREGDAGRQQIIQYGRYLTVGLCVLQGYAMASVLLRPEALGLQVLDGEAIVTMSRVPFLLLAVLTMTAALAARSRLKRLTVVPKRTVHSVREDVQWAKDQLKSRRTTSAGATH